MQVRCLHCHEPIEVPDEGDLSRVHCPSCGGSFSLVDESTAPYAEAEVRKLAHFELIVQVGVGAFGTVWKARDTQLDRVVAVKVPRAAHLDGDEAEMFLREARAAAQLKHPNIVAVHEVGREDQTVYIVSDFIQGATLDDWLTCRAVSPRETAELCRQIAEALHHAHEAGVVHRDLKPGNIMMDLTGCPHLLDFGLARRASREATMTVEGRVLGTPAYMSPEQAGGDAHNADRRTDIYSLGVIIFRLLTGELPFRGNSQMLLVQILKDEPPSPRKLNSHVPRDMETICLRCLEKDPEKRYTNALALAKDLERYLEGKPIEARAISRRERVWRWCRRNPALAGLLSTAAVILLLGTSVSSYFALLAESRSSVANERAAQALAEKDRADEEMERRRRLQYVSDISAAQRAWDLNGIGRGSMLLERNLDYADRGFEWYYLWRLYHGDGRAHRLPNVSAVQGLAADRAGGRLASAHADGSLKIWDLHTRQLARSIHGHIGRALSVAFHPEGDLIASGGVDGHVRVWDVRTGRPVGDSVKTATPVMSVAFSPDGSTLAWSEGAWGQRSVVKLRDMAGHSPDREIQCDGWIISFAFSHDSKFVAVALHVERVVCLFEVATQKKLASFEGHTAWVREVVFSPDGALLATSAHDGTARLWDLKTRRERSTLRGHSSQVCSVDFSSDSKLLATGSADNTIKVWDVTASREITTLKGHTSGVNIVRFSSEGRLVSGGSDGLLELWNCRLHSTGRRPRCGGIRHGSNTSRSRPTLGISPVSA